MHTLLPNNEADRLQALQQYDILDTSAEPAFDHLTSLAAQLCESPISLVSLLDKDRQWFKSKVGLTAQETERDVAFCAHAILQKELFIVTDALSDQRFATNPLVNFDPHIRFYAGAPLINPNGFALGTLCVIDYIPRNLSSKQQKALRTLADQVMTQLELRRSLIILSEAITKRHQAEAEVRQALKKEQELRELKSRFISMTSHEFRTPLSTILSSAELLEHYRHKWTEEKQFTHLKRIQTAVKQVTHMLNDVLIVGKLEAGKLEFNPGPLNLVEYCEQLVEELQLSTDQDNSLLQRPAISIIFTHQGICANPWMDEKLLHHILINLLSNAIKYSSHTALPVKFDLIYQDDKVIFQIQDQGIGIPTDEIPKLFEPFNRATNVGNIQGTGLGLTIVKNCVDMHQGEVFVKSEINVGTTFTVVLPLCPTLPDNLPVNS